MLVLQISHKQGRKRPLDTPERKIERKREEREREEKRGGEEGESLIPDMKALFLV